jgi:hypothetical protein
MTIQEARRSRTVKASKRPKRRKSRKTTAAPRRRKARKSRKTSARKPRRVRASRVASTVMAPRKKARRRVRRVRASVESWPGHRAAHRKAAKKGWRRKKAKRSRRTNEPSVVMAARRKPRRRKASRRAREHTYTTEAKRGRRSYRTREVRGKRGMQMARLAIATISGGLGFVIADGLDRLLATYDPAATEKPKDKFTSDGSGTLANTLNVAAAPGLVRLGAGLAAAAVPAVGAAFVVNPFLRSSLEGAAIGAGVNLFKTLWNNLLMPALGPKKDADQKTIQGSYIARLYPAEVAASINLASKKDAAGKMPEGPYPAAGVLSAQPGVGAPDVGPFALAADSPYPDAAQALRNAAGVQGPGNDYPTQQNVWGTGQEYPTAAQAMGTGGTGVAAWSPKDPPGVGPGPSARTSDEGAGCACLGDDNPFLGFIGDDVSDTSALMM